MIYILDASVALKWFLEEAGTSEAIKFRTDLLAGKLVLASPDLMLYEVANVLRLKPQFTETAVNEALRSLLNVGVEIFTPTEEVLEQAVHFMFRIDAPFYDCLYLALAHNLGSPLLTADEILFAKVKGLLPITLIRA